MLHRRLQPFDCVWVQVAHAIVRAEVVSHRIGPAGLEASCVVVRFVSGKTRRYTFRQVLQREPSAAQLAVVERRRAVKAGLAPARPPGIAAPKTISPFTHYKLNRMRQRVMGGKLWTRDDDNV